MKNPTDKEIEQEALRQEQLKEENEMLMQIAADNEQMEIDYARLGFNEPIER